MKKHWQYLSIGLGLLAVLAIIWRLLPAWNAGQPGQSGGEIVPQQIATLPRMELVSGPEAIRQIAMMHGKSIDLAEGYIASYRHGEKEITLWVSVSTSAEAAAALFRQMDEKMPASQVFRGRQELDIEGQQVIRVEGMGQEHYYWVKGKSNYWVAVSGIDGKEVVQEIID